MVEPAAAGRWAAGGTMMKKKMKKAAESTRKQSRDEEPESPSYRLALRSIFSCRNSSASSAPPDSSRSRSKKLGSMCKVKDVDKQGSSSRLPTDELEEACKRRASVSEKKKNPGLSEAASSSSLCNTPTNKQRLGERSSSSLSSSTTRTNSFRGGGGMQLRRLSGCYECHMVVDPIFRPDMARTISCPCPDCGEIFVRQESLQRHQSIRHAVSELGADDTSRNIIEIIFQSSWLKKPKQRSPVCRIERILKVHNTARTLARFEAYRDAVKAKATTNGRCTADGNELLRFHCAAMACSLGLHGATHLCAHPACAACAIIRDGFTISAGVIRTMATSGRAHDAAVVQVVQQQPAPGKDDDDDANDQQPEEEEGKCRRAMLVCRVIAGRVKRPQHLKELQLEDEQDEDMSEFESVAASAGVYSNMEELHVFNPTAILPCFVVIYRA